VSREDIVKGAGEIGVPLDEHIDFVLASMKRIALELGL
jgi:predicted hydrolase (HD superfamily)